MLPEQVKACLDCRLDHGNVKPKTESKSLTPMKLYTLMRRVVFFHMVFYDFFRSYLYDLLEGTVDEDTSFHTRNPVVFYILYTLILSGGLHSFSTVEKTGVS